MPRPILLIASYLVGELPPSYQPLHIGLFANALDPIDNFQKIDGICP